MLMRNAKKKKKEEITCILHQTQMRRYKTACKRRKNRHDVAWKLFQRWNKAVCKINVREYRRGNKKGTIQKNWQHMVHTITKNKQEHNTIFIGHHFACWEVSKDQTYVFTYYHMFYILMFESHLFYLKNDKTHVRTTWYDLFVLSQHEGDNRIHNIFSKSVM